MAKYLSGRVKTTPQSQLPEDRNRYLSVGDAEPNLGIPTINSTEGLLPVGDQYQIISILGYPGERYWIPRGGGLIPGSISVYDENFLVGTSNSITQLNFVGAAITVRAVPLGIAATITVFSPGNNQEILFNTNNDFGTSSKLKFDSNIGLLSAGDRISVGSGGTVITTTSGGLVGIGTTNPTQELHILGDLRLTGTIYDYLNDPGDVNQIIVKNNLGGLLWVDQGTIRSGAGGTYRDIQFHNSAGLVDGASNFVFDEVNSRIGIGSTQPKVLLDVLGISSFKGGTTIDNLNVTGVTTTSTLAVSGTTTTRNLQVTGVTTIGFVTGTSAYFTGIVTATKFVGEVNVTNLYVSGVSTFNQKVNIDSDLGVTGLTTTQNLQVYQSTTLNRLKVSGISTFDTQVNVNNLNVTGVGTFDNIKIYDNNIETTVGNLILNSFAGVTQINDGVYVTDTSQSISKDTGSIVTEGGVGIEKDLYVGGNLYVDGDIVADSADKVSTGTTTGTTNYYPTFVDSNNSTRTNEFLYTDAGISYNPSTNSLGIGTNNPKAALDVGIGSVYVSAGDIHGNGTLILFNTRDEYGGVFLNGGTDGDAYINNINPGGSTGFGVKLPSGSAGSFGAPNYENLYTTVETRHNGTEGITNFNGLVGIGTTNPSFRLQVDGDIYLNSRLVTSGSGVESSGTIIFSAVSSTSNIDHIWNSDVNVVDGVVGTQYGNLPGIYHFVNDGTYKSTGNSALRAGGFFNIDHTGTLNQKLQISGGAYISDNLGIGITNPTSKLQVAGDVTPSVTNSYDLGTESLKWRKIYATTIEGAIIGNADTATKLATPREIDISGDVLGVGIGTTFDGSRNVTIQTELSTTGVTAGTYGSSTRVGIITVDAKGRITSASNVNIDFSKATYADNAGISTNLKGGIASQIPYQSAANTTAFIPNGTSGQLLRSNGTSAPSWVTATDLSVSKATYADNAGISTNLKGGIASQIPYQSAANTTSFIPNGTSGQLLRSNGTSAPSWVTATAAGGITIQEEGSNVGNQLGITTVNFIGGSVTATSPTAGTANITVTAASNVTVTQTDYSCDNPITVPGGSTITIGSTSNAYGRKFVQTTTPISPCDGDIWYDTSGGTTGDNTPAGTVIYHAASAAPTGYLKANGASLSTTTYATLFASIGYTFGGSGASFNVPDLRGEFIRGWDDGKGTDSGRGFGTVQGDAFESHTHTISNTASDNLNSGAFVKTFFYYNTSQTSPASTGIPSTGSGTETRPRNIALLACIKY
jgi:microcystin-dependent protein